MISLQSSAAKHLRSLYLYTVVLEHGGTNCRVAIRPSVPESHKFLGLSQWVNHVPFKRLKGVPQ